MALTCNNENLRPHTDWYTNVRTVLFTAAESAKNPNVHQQVRGCTKGTCSAQRAQAANTHARAALTAPCPVPGPDLPQEHGRVLTRAPSRPQTQSNLQKADEWVSSVGAENTWITKGPRQLSQLFGTHLPCGTQQFHSQVIYPREKKICSYKNLYTNVHSSFICNSPKLESVWMPSTEWYTYTTYYCSANLTEQRG